MARRAQPIQDDKVEAPATKRRVLKAEDLVYKGSFAPPKSVQGISTSYTHIGLAMRVVAGKRRFFAGAGPYDAGHVTQLRRRRGRIE